MTKDEIIESLLVQAEAKKTLSFLAPYRTFAYDATVMFEAAELLKAAPEWISVKDRMPTPGKAVLVYAKRNGDAHNVDGIFCITCNTEEKDVNSFGWLDPWFVFSNSYEVTHWVPLPKPPKEEAAHEQD